MNNIHDQYIAKEETKCTIKTSQHEVVTLLTEEESDRLLNVYPSSPAMMETGSEILEVKRVGDNYNESIELDAPFCQDLSTSRDGDSSFSKNDFEDLEKEPAAKKTKKRLLDDILDDSSSYSYRNNSENAENTLSTIKNTPSKEELSKRRMVNSTRVGLPPLLTIKPKQSNPSIEYEKGMRNETVYSSSNCQNILEAFPLSSIGISSAGTNMEEGTAFDDIPKPMERVICGPLSEQSINNVRTKIVPDSSEADSSEAESKRNESEIIELSIRNFLAESEDSIFSTPFKQALPHLASTKTLNDNLGNVDQKDLSHTVSMGDILRLQQYVVKGKSFTKTQSEALVREWTQRNKGLFRQVNQIYRDNTKARQSILIEMPNTLIDQYEKSESNLREIIIPATLCGLEPTGLPLIKFLRRCDSTYDFNNDVYYPCESSLVEENLVMLYYDAQQFFERYRADKRKLFDDIASISRDDKYLIVVLSQLNKFKRSLQEQENQLYKVRVQEQLVGSQSGTQSRKSRKQKGLENLNMKYFDIAQRILHIDRMWGVKIYTVSSDADFIRTLPNLISIVGKQRMDPNIRYMRYCHINVKSCTDQKTVLTKTLREINRMPDLKASSVLSAYPTFQSLLADFEKSELKSGLDGKHIMTEAMEDRLFKLFTCRDANETIQ